MPLTLIIGPMHSGKTTHVLDEVSKVSAVGLHCLFINSTTDTRTDSTYSTHNKVLKNKESNYRNVDWVKVTRLGEITDVNKYSLIVVDEGQFYEDLRSVIPEWVDGKNKRVLVSGLNGDYTKKPFGQVLDLIPLITDASHLIYKTAYCSRCARETGTLEDAAYSYRLTQEEKSQVAVSGKKCTYETLCAKHYKEATNK